MEELLIYETPPGKESFTSLVHTLCSFGVGISLVPYEGTEKDLPISKLNGTIMKTGAYPTKQELISWLKVPEEFFEDESTGCSLNTDGCCGCGCCYE